MPAPPAQEHNRREISSGVSPGAKQAMQSSGFDFDDGGSNDFGNGSKKKEEKSSEWVQFDFS